MTLLSFLPWLAAAVALIALVGFAYLVGRTRQIAARAERLVPPTGRFITIDGCRIRYVEAGAGPAILMIHGLGAQLHQFQAPLFPLLSSDFRVIALDRPGSGYSTRPYAASARLTDQADLVARFIGETGIDRPLIVGHSLGGALALALAIRHPHLISGLALLAPLTRHRDTVPPELRGFYVRSRLKRWVLAQTISVPLGLRYAEMALAFIFSPQRPVDDYMIAGGGWLGLRPSAVYASGADLVALEEDMPAIEKRIGEIGLPVGVMFGTADKVLDYRLDGESMRQRLPGVEFQSMEGLGHMLQFVAPVETAAFIRRMAQKAALAAGPQPSAARTPDANR